jgi:hypothetical protein
MAVETPRRAPNKRVSLVPYGLNEQHPNHYKDILKMVWDNRDRLPYALRILRDGCCDGCSLGASILEDVSAVRGMSKKQLCKLGRLLYPMIRRNELGEYRGRVRIDCIKPGCLQGHWREVNVIVPAGRLDPSGVPDYNSAVEVTVAGRAAAKATA